jgi:hypothetical protein
MTLQVRIIALGVDRLVREVMLMPYGIEDTERTGEGDTENPG